MPASTSPGEVEATLALAQRIDPDVVLMDLRMPVMGGVTAIRRLRELGVRARVLVLTTYDTDSDVLPAIEAGATGYLLKDAPVDELTRAVAASARGEAVLSPAVASRSAASCRPAHNSRTGLRRDVDLANGLGHRPGRAHALGQPHDHAGGQRHRRQRGCIEGELTSA